MAGERHYVQACERAATVMQSLASLRLTPSPDNYRIWYAHHAAEDPSLSRVLKELLDSGEPIDDKRCAELYERFFVRVAEERTLLRAG